jgi:hypothetical protein
VRALERVALLKVFPEETPFLPRPPLDASISKFRTLRNLNAAATATNLSALSVLHPNSRSIPRVTSSLIPKYQSLRLLHFSYALTTSACFIGSVAAFNEDFSLHSIWRARPRKLIKRIDRH